MVPCNCAPAAAVNTNAALETSRVVANPVSWTENPLEVRFTIWTLPAVIDGAAAATGTVQLGGEVGKAGSPPVLREVRITVQVPATVPSPNWIEDWVAPGLMVKFWVSAVLCALTGNPPAGSM